MATSLNLLRNGAVGFIDWLGGWRCVGESVAIGANGNGEMKATGGDAEWAWALVLEYSSA